jgi:hypothetical protein
MAKQMMVYFPVHEVSVEALTTIGNHPDLIKECEPHIAFPQELKSWMVARVLTAQEKLLTELAKDGKL